MEKPSFLGHGALRLPPGFRFHPTDQELVLQYLRRKVYSCPLPASIIPEIDLCKYNPWDLLDGCEEEKYFFSLREAKGLKGCRSNRAARSGYWKVTGKDKQIIASNSKHVVGMKKVLVFCHGKPPKGCRTELIMHEYRLAGAAEIRACSFAQMKNSTYNYIVPSNCWVLCRIFKKKRATKMNIETEEYCNEAGNSVGPGDSDQHAPSSTSSDSSCVTDLSVDSSNEEETISSSSTSSAP
ncbi:NAC domain-containing protein 83-like [Typha angustifolia]|uniref:NAC domain-containing protein 83-like n=1 Tax=Typha angustifolia TaxID=59011 RepID=UPI003C2C0B6C